VIIPPEGRSAHDIGLERYLSTGEAKVLGKHIEVVAIDRTGRRFPAELSTTEIRHDGQRLFLGFIRDISARKDAEAHIAEVTERLRLAVGTHSIGIFDTNVETGGVHWNEELEAIYGYAPRCFDPTLEAWRRHVFPADLELISRHFREAISEQRRDLAYSYRMTRCDGELRNIEASVRFFYDAEGKNIRRVGVNIDVTERKRTERRLIETEAELAHLSRLGSLGAMASSLGHELNQPLTSIVNYVSAAKRLAARSPSEETAQILDALEQASAGALRAADLIRRLRALSSKQPVDTQEISLTAVVQETSSLLLDNPICKSIEFTVAIEPEADRVHADPILLQQVMFNLLKNAAEAITGAGAITVRAAALNEDEVVVEVQDTGPGLDPKVKADLFTAFISTKSEGMGVGLSICRTIIENQGGRIWADENQRGTSFFLTIPRRERQADKS
jgi:two-component system sensor kinase FixL